MVCRDLKAQKGACFVSSVTKNQVLRDFKESWTNQDSEFTRILRIRNMDMVQGVDTRLLPNCIVVFEEMLHELGISYKDRRELSVSILESSIKSIISGMKSVRKMGLREHWSVPRDRLSDIISTSGRISCTYSILSGVALFLSICCEDSSAHRKIISGINTDVFSFTKIEKTKKGLYRSTTRVNSIPSGEVIVKKLGRVIDSSKVGAIVRLLNIQLGFNNFIDCRKKCPNLDWMILTEHKVHKRELLVFHDERDNV